jgi:hypothetical protein
MLSNLDSPIKSGFVLIITLSSYSNSKYYRLHSYTQEQIEDGLYRKINNSLGDGVSTIAIL